MSVGNWTCRRVSDGAFLVDPRGIQWGMIRVRQGQPLRCVTGVLAAVRARSSDELEPSECRRLERIVTDAGEFGGLAELISPNGLVRLIGSIAGPTDAVTLEGICAIDANQSTFAASFTQLIRSWAAGHQPERVRMFEYRPPARWRGMRRSLSTLWLGPLYPQEPASIEVFDAVPIGDSSAVYLADIFAGPDCTEIVDARFVYRLCFAGPKTYRAAFDAVVESVKLLPAPAPSITDPEFAWVL